MFALVLAILAGLAVPSSWKNARLFLVNGALVAGVLWGWLLARAPMSSKEASRSVTLQGTIAAIWFPLPVSRLAKCVCICTRDKLNRASVGFSLVCLVG